MEWLWTTDSKKHLRICLKWVRRIYFLDIYKHYEHKPVCALWSKKTRSIIIIMASWPLRTEMGTSLKALLFLSSVLLFFYFCVLNIPEITGQLQFNDKYKNLSQPFKIVIIHITDRWLALGTVYPASYAIILLKVKSPVFLCWVELHNAGPQRATPRPRWTCTGVGPSCGRPASKQAVAMTSDYSQPITSTYLPQKSILNSCQCRTPEKNMSLKVSVFSSQYFCSF